MSVKILSPPLHGYPRIVESRAAGHRFLKRFHLHLHPRGFYLQPAAADPRFEPSGTKM